MSDDAIYRQEFWKSPHHLALGAVCGVAVVSGSLLWAIVGITAYVLGAINIPHLNFFKQWVDARQQSKQNVELQQQVAAFQERRNKIINRLSSGSQSRYGSLVAICKAIESSTSASDSEQGVLQKKLDELSWTYLRMLDIQQSLEQFVESERSEDIPSVVKQAELEAKRIQADIEQAGPIKPESKQRLLQSKLERLDTLRKRLDRGGKAYDNLELVKSEQDRLVDQAKLIRADAAASRDADTLTAKIDATVEHIGQTSQWMSEMEEFRDVIGEVPDMAGARIGYGSIPSGNEVISQPTRKKLRGY